MTLSWMVIGAKLLMPPPRPALPPAAAVPPGPVLPFVPVVASPALPPTPRSPRRAAGARGPAHDDARERHRAAEARRDRAAGTAVRALGARRTALAAAAGGPGRDVAALAAR